MLSSRESSQPRDYTDTISSFYFNLSGTLLLGINS